ncbi:hypothetical protein J3F83DRAFT_711005 [Trichoderma novae-zelandiae]
MAPKRPLPLQQKSTREIAETPQPGPSSSPSSSPPPPSQKARREEVRPVSLRDAPGNLRWVNEDIDGNIAGIASIAYVAVSMLERLSAGNASAADHREAHALVDFVGGSQALDAFRTRIHEHVGSFGPEPTVFRHLFGDKAWEATQRAYRFEAAGEEPLRGGREASIELGTTPTPEPAAITTGGGREASIELGATPTPEPAAITAGGGREASIELGATPTPEPAAITAGRDREASSELGSAAMETASDSSDEALAPIKSKYFGGETGGKA